MKKTNMIKNIIFDFDGVILDAVPLKTEAYRILFKNFPNDTVEIFIHYHLENGGISRYKKVQYFFEELLSKKISEKEINNFAEKYSELTKEELSKAKYLIEDTLNFIQKNYQKYDMHIASGADEQDLLYICDKLNIAGYFKSINGSPTVKNEIVKNIMHNNMYKEDETCMIGDSINDFVAADVNGITFYGYNNNSLTADHSYLYTFKDFCSQ